MQEKKEQSEVNKTCPVPVSCCGNKLFLLEVDDATGFQTVSVLYFFGVEVFLMIVYVAFVIC